MSNDPRGPRPDYDTMGRCNHSLIDKGFCRLPPRHEGDHAYLNPHVCCNCVLQPTPLPCCNPGHNEGWVDATTGAAPSGPYAPAVTPTTKDDDLIDGWAFDDCTTCKGKVQPDGTCPCDDDGLACAGFLVRPHACNPHWRNGSAAVPTPATTGQEGLRKRVADLILAAWPRWEAKSEVAQTLADMLAPFIQAEVAAAVTEALQQAEERVTALPVKTPQDQAVLEMAWLFTREEPPLTGEESTRRWRALHEASLAATLAAVGES